MPDNLATCLPHPGVLVGGFIGIAVKGWASDDDNFTNYGGHFCSSGKKGIAVYGWAENTDNVVNYGGKFLAEGTRGVGIHAKGGMWAGEFDGPVKIKGYASISGNVNLFSQQAGSAIMTLGEGLDFAEAFEVTDRG